MRLLVIEQVHEDTDIQSDHVRCPSCKKGRLCDKPVGDKVFAIEITDTARSQNSSRIILKCPKCAHRFLIRLTRDENDN